jgi:DNA polymerase-3 subunit gamma/tau
MEQAIYRKYRPRGWSEVVGQEHVVRTIRNAIVQDRVAHAYLFAGPRGTGKTTLARILAKAVNCLAEDRDLRPCNECEHCRAVNENRFLDLIEMDAASHTGVEDVRELRDKIGFAPSQGRSKVYIVDEVHMLSTAAFNALLKTLEEPPPHAIFVLATTEIQKIPATVLSRCQRHEFRRIPLGDIVENLRGIVAREGWQADDDALALIARQATGSIRDAQSLLDQLASGGAGITLELAQPVLGTATNQSVIQMVEAVRMGQAGHALSVIQLALDSGVDPRTLARQTVEYLRGVLLLQMGNGEQLEVIKEVRGHMQVHAAALPTRRVMRMIRMFTAAAGDTRGGWQPSLPLELALAETMEGNPESAKPDAGPAAGGAFAARAERPEASEKGPTARHPGVAPRPSGGAKRESSVLDQPKEKTTADSGLSAPAAPAQNPNDPLAKEAAIKLEEVARGWREIRSALKRGHPAVDGLLNSCKPIEIRGDVLVLGFQSEVVRGLMDRAENIEAARRAILDVLGISLQLRCLVVNAVGKVPPDLPQDGMVATAMNHGGEIVDRQE